jgi:hypothetical protein
LIIVPSICFQADSSTPTSAESQVPTQNCLPVPSWPLIFTTSTYFAQFIDIFRSHIAAICQHPSFSPAKLFRSHLVIQPHLNAAIFSKINAPLYHLMLSIIFQLLQLHIDNYQYRPSDYLRLIIFILVYNTRIRFRLALAFIRTPPDCILHENFHFADIIFRYHFYGLTRTLVNHVCPILSPYIPPSPPRRFLANFGPGFSSDNAGDGPTSSPTPRQHRSKVPGTQTCLAQNCNRTFRDASALADHLRTFHNSVFPDDAFPHLDLKRCR